MFLVADTSFTSLPGSSSSCVRQAEGGREVCHGGAEGTRHVAALNVEDEYCAGLQTVQGRTGAGSWGMPTGLAGQGGTMPAPSPSVVLAGGVLTVGVMLLLLLLAAGRQVAGKTRAWWRPSMWRLRRPSLVL